MEADCRLRTARADTGNCQERQRQKKAETEKRQKRRKRQKKTEYRLWGRKSARTKRAQREGPVLHRPLPLQQQGRFFPLFFGTSAENFRQSRAQTVNKNFRNCKVSCIDLRNKVI
ncbi:hypothetical protein CLOM621_08400 [Clostridium sp. M62/1]|nr:hypothetical protein CLOM621_08400 [Clostridium sp. M62/1]